MTMLDLAIHNYLKAVEAHYRASVGFQKAGDAFLENERKELETVCKLRQGIENLQSKLDLTRVQLRKGAV